MDLINRTFQFSIDTMKVLKTLPYSKEFDVLRYQLSKSGTSIGANYEEAQGAFSKSDFTYKIAICHKEAREANYWIRIIVALELTKDKRLLKILQESLELKRIFESIMKKLNYRDKKSS